MNVYDFDNTIYRGESVLDFYLFLLRRHPYLITMLPKLTYMLIKYKACRITTQDLILAGEKYALSILTRIDVRAYVNEFWDKNQHKIKKFYLDNKSPDDVVISASWDFLIEEICKRLGVRYVIASKIDIQSGKITRLCFGDKKVQLFNEIFPKSGIDNFYTDSMNDAPMFSISNHSFIVRGNRVKEVSL